MTITPRRWCWNNAHCPSRAAAVSTSKGQPHVSVTGQSLPYIITPSGPPLSHLCLGLPFPTLVWAFPSPPLSGPSLPHLCLGLPFPPLSGPSLPHLCQGRRAVSPLHGMSPTAHAVCASRVLSFSIWFPGYLIVTTVFQRPRVASTACQVTNIDSAFKKTLNILLDNFYQILFDESLDISRSFQSGG